MPSILSALPIFEFCLQSPYWRFACLGELNSSDAGHIPPMRAICKKIVKTNPCLTPLGAFVRLEGSSYITSPVGGQKQKREFSWH